MTLITSSCPASPAKVIFLAFPGTEAYDIPTFPGDHHRPLLSCRPHLSNHHSNWPAVVLTLTLRQSLAIPDIDHNFHPRYFRLFQAMGIFLIKVASKWWQSWNHHQINEEAAPILQHSWNRRALDDEKFCRTSLQFRNAPSRKDGLSSSQKLFGHPVKDILPAHQCSFLPQWQQTIREATQHTVKSSAAYYYTHAHNLPDIHVGSHVAVQNPRSRHWDIFEVITEIHPHHTVDIISRRLVAEF